MYNSINPINITYRKPNQSLLSASAYAAQTNQTPVDADAQGQKQSQQFPNGTKVAIDYTKNTINISQILTDFKSTIVAINAPEDVSDEVYSYLSLVEKESNKQNPQKEIIVSNLKNASRVSDAYIAKSLNKPSKVVEGWIDALFMQKIELKSDPTHINPDFQLEIPDKKAKAPEHKPIALPNSEVSEENLDKPALAPTPHSVEIEHSQPLEQAPIAHTFAEAKLSQEPKDVERNEIESQTVASQVAAPVKVNALMEEQPALTTVKKDETLQLAKPAPTPKQSKFVSSSADFALSKNLKEAKRLVAVENDPASALQLLNDALGEVDESTNQNLRAAIHFERGKIFDNYDYVEYALRDFWEASKCDDNNLKSQAHLKMARIYDDYAEFDNALGHYQDALGFGAEAENLHAQTKILGEIGSLFASRFDYDNVEMTSEVAVDTAKISGDNVLISSAYRDGAKNFEYIGEDFRALDFYKNALKSVQGEKKDAKMYEKQAADYESASLVMEKLGNHAKAQSLLSKAQRSYQMAQLASLDEAV